PVLRTDPAPETWVAREPPSFVEVTQLRRPTARRVRIPARKAPVQQREYEPAALTDEPADGGHQSIEIVDVGQPVVADSAVEFLAGKHSGPGHMGVDIPDPLRPVRLQRTGNGEELSGDVD